MTVIEPRRVYLFLVYLSQHTLSAGIPNDRTKVYLIHTSGKHSGFEALSMGLFNPVIGFTGPSLVQVCTTPAPRMLTTSATVAVLGE